MAEVFGITANTVYDKIDFIHRQCLKFVEMREARLLKGMKLPTMYLSVDRQYYTSNWLMYEDRRNIRFYGLGAADNTTGYVFTMAVNYDPSISYADLTERSSPTGILNAPHLSDASPAYGCSGTSMSFMRAPWQRLKERKDKKERRKRHHSFNRR